MHGILRNNLKISRTHKRVGFTNAVDGERKRSEAAEAKNEHRNESNEKNNRLYNDTKTKRRACATFVLVFRHQRPCLCWCFRHSQAGQFLVCADAILLSLFSVSCRVQFLTFRIPAETIIDVLHTFQAAV